MKHVFVVDDDPGIRGFLELVLESEGYRVETASDGAEALVKACANPPSAIVLDLNMPVLDGRDFLAAWHGQPDGHSAPVLAISAAGERLCAADLGVQSYVPKPFDLDALLGELADLL